MSQPVVSITWLKQQLDAGSPDVVVLDATWDPAAPRHSHALYRTKHISGAIFFDLNACIKPRATCARNVPDVTDVTEYARSLGINSHSHLVVYDRRIITASTKTWWIFRVFGHTTVSVLDGGLIKWQSEGHSVVSGEERCKQRGDFVVKLQRHMIVEFDEMLEIVRTGTSQIVDSRSADHFKGKEREPCLIVRQGLHSMDMPLPSSMQAGHMPQAINIHFPQVLDTRSLCFRPKDQLLKLFADAGVDLTKPMVTTCYIGHSASMINMAALLCGYQHMSLYYGSWTEYGQQAPSDCIMQDTMTS